jgi:cytochrome c556
MKNILMTVVLSVSLVAVGTVTLAHDKATGVVKERMVLMKNLGKSMKALSQMMRGREPYDAAKVKALAKELADHGSTTLTKLFPEGSLDKPTEARPEIWQDWDKFTALANQLTDYAKALEQAADNDTSMPGPGMGMGNGMMGQGGGRMMGPSGGPMMQGGTGGPSAEHLAQMPPNAAFMNIARTCSGCHQDFRIKK